MGNCCCRDDGSRTPYSSYGSNSQQAALKQKLLSSNEEIMDREILDDLAESLDDDKIALIPFEKINLTKRIASGMEGTVYSGTWGSSGWQIAVKEMKRLSSKESGKRLLDQFRHEAKILGKRLSCVVPRRHLTTARAMLPRLQAR